jgi:hypothetical protein
MNSAALGRISQRLLLSSGMLLASLQQAQGQVCAVAEPFALLATQQQVTLIVPPNTVPDRVNQWLLPEANLWKTTCQGNTEGLPTFVTASGNAFGPGQNANNSILVQFNPGASPNGTGALYDPKTGTMTLYGAYDVKNPLDWSQQSVHQVITHEIGHALGLDHDNCASNSMMQASPPKGLILAIQPGECLLADYVNCDIYNNPKCPKQDPRKPPVNNSRLNGLRSICQQLPDLCRDDPNQVWLIIWDCIATTVTYTECFGDPCPVNVGGDKRAIRSPAGASITPMTTSAGWAKDDVVCYPDFVIPQANVDPTPLTDGATGPAVTILTPTEGQTVAGIVQISGAALQPITGAGKMAFWLDGQPIQLTSFTQGVSTPAACGAASGGTDPYCPNVGFTGTFDSRTVPNMAHTLQAVVLDRRSSYPAATYSERHFTTNNSCFDTTPPTVSVTSPANSATVSGVVAVSVAASDNVTVRQASLYVDGAIVATWSTPPYTYSWSSVPGSHTLQARAADGCGNTAASSVVRVNVIASVRLYVDVPAPYGSIAGTNFGMAGWASDPFGIVTVSFGLDGQSLPLSFYKYGVSRGDVCNAYPGDPNCPNVGWNANFNSTCFVNGSHTLVVTATDSIGQTGTANWPVAISNSPAPSSSMTWMQPQASAGYGPPGSLIVAGSAHGGSNCGGVLLWWRDVTAGSAWNVSGYAPLPDSNGTWINSIPNVNYFHQYAAYVVYSGATSATCNYPGTNSLHWCP